MCLWQKWQVFDPCIPALLPLPQPHVEAQSPSPSSNDWGRHSDCCLLGMLLPLVMLLLVQQQHK
jgi:hypothetical protein